MGKNHQRSKILKSEKNKTHLKTSKAKKLKDKHLPKGTNVTNTSFKVKSIVIRDQLKSHSQNEILTKRHLNIKDLLTRLEHHNTTVRTDGLSGIKELISSDSHNVILQNLSNLLQKCGKLILDRERPVRKESLKVIQLILQNVETNKIAPFFSSLVSFLCCAMTHIDTNIQEDSLFVLDTLLENAAPLVAESFPKIMSNFINLISKLRNDANPGRTLTVNLGSKITSVKWRIKVLSRLNSMLEAVIDKYNKTDVEKTVYDCKVAHIENGNFIPVYYNQNVLQSRPYDIFASAKISEKEEESISKYISNLVPLLFETWLEVSPNKNMLESSDDAISQETASTLSCVMNILYMLWIYIKVIEKDDRHNTLSRGYTFMCSYKFVNFIFQHFPYTQNTMESNNKKARSNIGNVIEVNSDPKCIKENLLICYMFSVFNRTLNNDAQKQNAKNMIKYLNIVLTNRNYISNDNVKYIILVAKVIIHENSIIWCKATIEVESFLESLLHFEAHSNLRESETLELFNLLCDVVQKDNLKRTQAFQIWLSKLPSLLLKPAIPLKIVDTLLLLAKQKKSIFLKSFSRNLPEILENLPRIEISGSDRTDSMEIISIFYYMPSVFQEQIDAFNKFFETNAGTKIAENVKDILELREMRHLK